RERRQLIHGGTRAVCGRAGRRTDGTGLPGLVVLPAVTERTDPSRWHVDLTWRGSRRRVRVPFRNRLRTRRARTRIGLPAFGGEDDGEDREGHREDEEYGCDRLPLDVVFDHEDW